MGLRIGPQILQSIVVSVIVYLCKVYYLYILFNGIYLRLCLDTDILACGLTQRQSIQLHLEDGLLLIP